MLNDFPNSANRPKEKDFILYVCICFSLRQDPETHLCNFYHYYHNHYYCCLCST